MADKRKKKEVPEGKPKASPLDAIPSPEDVDLFLTALPSIVDAVTQTTEMIQPAIEAAMQAKEVVLEMMKWPLKNVKDMQELAEALSSITNVHQIQRNDASAHAFHEKWSKRAGEGVSFNILSNMTLGECSTLLPFVNVILERREKEVPEGSTLEKELEIQITPQGKITKNPCAEIVEEARAEAAKIPGGRIITKPVEQVIYPLGKPGTALWNAAELASKESGQFQYNEYITNKTRKAYLLCIDFSGLKGYGVPMDSKLTKYDKRVFVAVHALYYAGNEYMTLSMIYRAMGNTSRPDTDALAKVRASLLKMKCRLIFDNAEEVELFKKYDRLRYDGDLLQFEMVEGISIVNNMACDTVIHLLAPSFIYRMDTSTNRMHITTIKPSLLNTAGRQTEDKLSIEDYLIIAIANMKRNRRKHKIEFDTLYRECGITRRQYKSRAIETARKTLQLYKRKMWITDFEEPEGEHAFIIKLPKKKK